MTNTNVGFTVMTRMNKGVLLILAIALIAGAGVYLAEKNQTTPEPSKQTSPQDTQMVQSKVYHGILPCADCSGLDTTLTLSPDNTYSLSEVYQGKNDDNPFVTHGRWEEQAGTPRDPEAKIYVLTAGNGSQTFYGITNETEITMLDQDKNPIDAPFNTSLTLQ